MSDELKPCPFCGGTEIDTHGDDKVVGYHCLTCDAVGPNQYITYPEPREWNTRHDTHADLIAKADDLAKAVERLTARKPSPVTGGRMILEVDVDGACAALSAYTQVREGK